MGPDYELGLQRLKEQLQQKYKTLPTEFAVLEARLLQNLKDERLYGSEPTGQANFSRIMHALNSFTYEQLNISFNDLCTPSFQPPASQPSFTRGQKPATKGGPMPPGPQQAYDGVGKYWTVLVGVGTYEDTSYHHLPVCVDDAKVLAKQLTRNGYDPEYMRLLIVGDTDKDPLIEELTVNAAESKPTLGNIIAALQTIAKETQPEDLLLFYYTGHGNLEDNESYLVTHSGRRGSLKHTALPVSVLKEIMDKAPAEKKVIILDTCRRDATPDSKGTPRPLPPAFIEHVFEQARGIAILTSCDAGQESYAWEERGHSVFTYYLLEALQGNEADFNGKDRMSVDDVYNYVYKKVKVWATRNNRSQTPQRTTEGQGSIVLAYSPQAGTATTAPGQHSAAILPSRVNARSWKDIETLSIQGEHYTLERTSVREQLVDDEGATLRMARARHRGTDLLLQLKQVHSVDTTEDGMKLQEILKKERQILIDLENEGYRDFPRVFPLIESDAEKDFTFAYIITDEKSLKQAFSGAKGPLDKPAIERLLRAVLPLCGALSILHKKGLSHRRLSADELFLLKGRYAMMQHIGLAARQPKKGEDAGRHRAPEQERKSDLVDKPGPATDIYQLGAILHFLITGRIYTPGSLPGMKNPAVSSSLEHAIIRAVERQPENRWPDIEAFAAALRQEL